MPVEAKRLCKVFTVNPAVTKLEEFIGVVVATPDALVLAPFRRTGAKEHLGGLVGLGAALAGPAGAAIVRAVTTAVVNAQGSPSTVTEEILPFLSLPRDLRDSPEWGRIWAGQQVILVPRRAVRSFELRWWDGVWARTSQTRYHLKTSPLAYFGAKAFLLRTGWLRF